MPKSGNSFGKCGLKAPMTPHEVASHADRTLAFDIPNHVRHRVFGRNSNQHVDMVWTQVALQYLAFPLLGQCMKNLSKTFPDLAVKRFATAFRDENYAVLALPFRVI